MFGIESRQTREQDPENWNVFNAGWILVKNKDTDDLIFNDDRKLGPNHVRQMSSLVPAWVSNELV